MIRIFHRHVGHRGSFLVAFAVVDLVYALTLFTSDPESTAVYRWFDAVVPLWVWGVAWMVVGIVCGAFAFRENKTVGFQAAWIIKVVWALGSMAGFAVDDVPPSGIAIWCAFAFIAWRIAGWPDPPSMHDDRERDDRIS